MAEVRCIVAIFWHFDVGSLCGASSQKFCMDRNDKIYGCGHEVIALSFNKSCAFVEIFGLGFLRGFSQQP